MRLHPNAKLTPSNRRLLVRRVRELGWNVSEAAEAAGVSRQTAYKWLRRSDAEGTKGLEDRSSRPLRIPIRTPRRLVERIERKRRRRATAWEIAKALELPPSTVSKILKQQGLGRLWRVDQELSPPQRYEHDAPGSLLHIDAKRLGRIDGIGHRIHGDRRRRSRGVGWEVVFVCVDDHSRLSYAEVLPRENAHYATLFLRRALRWFERHGIQAQRILSDNAKCYDSKVFRALCAERGIRQIFTKPYTPRTNGKAERFIQTLIRRWAYRTPYRTSALRTAALGAWLSHYNHARPHRALGMKPPIARLRAAREQRA